MMQLIFFFATFDSDTVRKVENDGDILISSSRIILSYFPYFRLQERELKGTRIRYESSSSKNIFSFSVIRYFMSLFFLLLGERTWKLGKSKKLRPTIIRGKRNSRRRDERKYRSYVVHQPVIFLWRRCIRYRMWILTVKVVAHLTASRLIDIFDVVEIQEKREGLLKIERLFPMP